VEAYYAVADGVHPPCHENPVAQAAELFLPVPNATHGFAPIAESPEAFDWSELS